jgi:hypothetical protein
VRRRRAGRGEAEGWIDAPPARRPASAPKSRRPPRPSACSSEGRFVLNGDSTVTDNCTGLVRQQDTGNGGNGSSWRVPLRYFDSLESAGHDDGRLPNIGELHSLIDWGRFDPAIDPVFGALSSAYWSSTSYAVGPATARRVHFFGAGGDDISEGDALYFRAVRGGR